MNGLWNRLDRIAAGIVVPDKFQRVWAIEESDIERTAEGFTDQASGESFTWEECRQSGVRFFKWADESFPELEKCNERT